ncbi:hypothetical protein GWO43_15575, partial [candidate division KSB1 bacterium]|nr:hypothetical protein [candidate division KSB1 bacterium]NIR68434.1 hypothetical protein [candidate division KSB1 bacterium]NIS25386.1 hypothetical protein [candidate division KSB1 bacterium]NIT72263.1 hypothetical protein [candidate division KSB1 bacterium]NIU26068.1 hypothetical protein [candidate division KSB1 bacterium]
MIRKQSYLGGLACLSVFLYLSCATVHFQKDIADYETEMTELEAKLAANPNDFDTLRRLGVIYFETA